MVLHYFLGANGGTGFQSLYEPFVAPKEQNDILILKGGPGTGKSSFMKYIGEKAEAKGLDVEYIWCSGDPESLDAIRLPGVGVIVVDGTAPHVIEPRYPTAVDRYVNLGQFHDVAACKANREQIVHSTEDYRSAYGRAYHMLGAAAEVEETIRAQMIGGLDRVRLEKRAAGIASREFARRSKKRGRTTLRFLGGITCRGNVVRFDTVAGQCARIYEIRDSYGLSDELLRLLHRAAAASGYDAVVSPDPNRPEAIRHLLVPEAGVAFITLGEGERYPGQSFRRFHLDLLVDQELRRRNRARLRFQRRVHQAMLEEGIAALQEAKKYHDLLEQLYNPAVDFAGVYDLAEREWQRICSWIKTKEED